MALLYLADYCDKMDNSGNTYRVSRVRMDGRKCSAYVCLLDCSNHSLRVWFCSLVIVQFVHLGSTDRQQTAGQAVGKSFRTTITRKSIPEINWHWSRLWNFRDKHLNRSNYFQCKFVFNNYQFVITFNDGGRRPRRGGCGCVGKQER